MSATIVPAPTTTSSHGLRVILVTAAIVVLLALTFVAGRATGSTTSKAVPTPTPAASASGPASFGTSSPASTDAPCHMGRAC